MNNKINEEHNVPEKKLTLGLITSWVSGVLLGLAGLTALFSDTLTGILYILISLILLPPVVDFVKRKYNFSLSRGLKMTIVIILLVLTGVIAKNDTIASLTNSVSPTSSVTEVGLSNIEIVNISTKVIEKNEIWWKFAWNLTLKNNTAKARIVTAEIKWIDADGFVVDSHRAYSLTVPSNQEKVFNDFTLIDTSSSYGIVGVEAEI